MATLGRFLIAVAPPCTQGPFPSDYSPLRLSQNVHPPGRRGFSIDIIHPASYLYLVRPRCDLRPVSRV